MPEEEHEHQHSEHNHSSHEKKKEEYSFKLSKARLWQGISFILVIDVIFLWINPRDNATGAVVQVQQPQIQAGPSQNPSQAQQAQQRVNIDIGNSPSLGPKNAKVTVVEFSDFQCPYCGAAMGTQPDLITRFKSQNPNWEAAGPKLEELAKQGKIRLVFKQFPLDFHQNALPAAEASLCANEQGKFWEYQGELFKNQEKLGKALYIELAGNLGLNKDKFTQCIDSNKYKQKVQDELDYGKQIGVSGTPTFFINGLPLVGAQPYSAFKQIIDEELKK